MTDLILQQPDAVDGQAAQLLLLIHGVGSSAEDLRSPGAVAG